MGGSKRVVVQLGWMLLVAGAYVVAGKLALMMAIPPGYATAVWPAAGVAVVATLHGGYRMAPAVAVGSFLVNVPSDLAALRTIVAAIIALGAALQAAAAAAVVRRAVGYPAPLERTGDVVRFLLGAGPLASVIAATLATTTLLVAGIATRPTLAFTWATWWVGDTIGVLIFAPVLLSVVSGATTVWRRRRRTVTLPMVIGFAIVAALFMRASAWEVERQQADFDRRADVLTRAVERQSERIVDAGLSLAGLFRASESVTAGELGAFAGQLVERHPGILAVSWIARVPGAERAAYEAGKRSTDTTDFRIWQRDARGAAVEAAVREEYFVVEAIAPDTANRLALGFDLGADPVRRAALDHARDHGVAAATAPVQLVQDSSEQPGFLVLVPVYRGHVLPTSVEERRSSLSGYTSTVVRATDIVTAATRGLELGGARIRVYDQDPSGTDTLLDGDLVRSRSHLAIRTSSFEVAGRLWRVEVVPSADGVDNRRKWDAWALLLGGLLFLAMLGAFLLIVTGNESRLRDNERDLAFRLELSDAVRATEDRDELAATVALAVGTHLRVTRSFLGEVDLDREIMVVHRDFHRGHSSIAGASTLAAYSLETQAALRAGHTVVVSDAARDPRTAPRFATGYEPLGLRALLGVPLLRDGRWVASLWAAHDQPRSWEPREAVLLQSIAEQTWLWLEHTRMVAQLRDLNQTLEERIVARTHALEVAVQEKDVLLREIHHRVKNNLQVISSLLNLQSMSTVDPGLRTALSESRDRVQSLALVHDQLYQATNAASIDVAGYLRDLVLSIERSYRRAAITIVVEATPCTLPLDQVVPCGLIVNELITNALKHAFPDDRVGTIRVSAKPDSDGVLRLSVADDGVGLPTGFDLAGSQGLGMVIVDTLSQQLGATLSIERSGGTAFELCIPLRSS